ncbi:replication initiator protein [Microviridae sp.]|nr:replication initiator protein [Microviridae sp.]
MICAYPYTQKNSGASYGCGQCLPCRINKKRMWTGRIVLESMCHSKTAFITLTYAPEFLPDNGSLIPKHLTDFLKRVRYYLEKEGRKMRYFAVGEYGDQTKRPHYHIALFGIDYTERELIEKSWKFGIIDMGRDTGVTPDSASYIAGYVTKKMTNGDGLAWNGYDPELMLPEFTRMSRMPAIGSGASTLMAEQFEGLCEYVALHGDVPSQLNVSGKNYPLDATMKKYFRSAFSIDDDQKEMLTANVTSKIGVKNLDTYFQYMEKNPDYLQIYDQGLILQKVNASKLKLIEAKHKFFKTTKRSVF